MIIIFLTLITLALGEEESPLFKPQIYSTDFFSPSKDLNEWVDSFPVRWLP